jgi:hypothetical protein
MAVKWDANERNASVQPFLADPKRRRPSAMELAADQTLYVHRIRRQVV